MKNKISIILLLSITIILFSCKNDKLTREQAQQLIEAKLQYPNFEYNSIETEERSNSPECYHRGLTIYVLKCPICNYEKVENLDCTVVSEKFQKLENVGLITVNKNATYTDLEGSIGYTCPNGANTPQEHSYHKQCRDYFNHAEFTEKAKPLVNGNNVRVTITKFGTINGIVENNNTAEVEYTEIKTATPFGVVFDSPVGTESKRITFIKYDDGWRIRD